MGVMRVPVAGGESVQRHCPSVPTSSLSLLRAGPPPPAGNLAPVWWMRISVMSAQTAQGRPTRPSFARISLDGLFDGRSQLVTCHFGRSAWSRAMVSHEVRPAKIRLDIMQVVTCIMLA
jgi:hypothetical protein